MEWLGTVVPYAGQPLRPACQEAEHTPEPPEDLGRFFDSKPQALRLNDKQTGLPLVFAPNPNLPLKHEGGTVDGELVANYHHPAHPRVQLEHGTIEQQAIRSARTQWVTTRDHWGGYHGSKLQPQLPGTPRESFIYVASAALRYVTPQAITFNNEGEKLIPGIRNLTAGDKKKLWGEGQLCVDSYYKVRRFLADYVLRIGYEDPSHETSQLTEMYMDNSELMAQALLRSLVKTAIYENGFGKVFDQAKKYLLLPIWTTKFADDSIMELLLPGAHHLATLEKDEDILERLHSAATASVEGVAA